MNLNSSLAEHAFIATRIADIETWHRRLGHLNARSIVEMSDRQMVKGMHIDLSSVPAKCQHCILAKQTRSSVPKTREGNRAAGLLDCVYIDLTGPHVTSATGNSYAMNLIDDNSSMVWAIPIPHKSSAIKALKDWVPCVEKETGRSVRLFRVDNGELKSTEYAEFCTSRGIKMQWTSPHTSAHIGKVERVHRTLFASARTMRLSSGLPPNRWDEFILTAAYLKIRVPTKALTNMTPFEVYHKHKPDLSEIGSRAFVLILNKHNPKVFQRSEECVLIGYSANSKSYRCYHRASHKVTESFHVVFIESKDNSDRPFRPGVTQGLDDDDPTIPAPNLSSIPPATATVTPLPCSPSVNTAPTSVTPVIPVALAPLAHPPATDWKSSRIPVPSTRLAEAVGFNKIDTDCRIHSQQNACGCPTG